jgi:hypothetical protein
MKMRSLSFDDVLAERAARAVKDQQVKIARARIESLGYQPPSIQDFVRRLNQESETARILIFYSYLDDLIRGLMALHMTRLEEDQDGEKMFGSYGPLSTFSSRVLMAYHLGWLTKQVKERLDAFRRVRNEFAHETFSVTIEHPNVAKDLAIIDYDIQSVMENAFGTEGYDFSQANSALCRLIMLAFEAARDLLILPIATALDVDPAWISPHYDDQPELLKAVDRAMSAGLIEAGAVRRLEMAAE